MERHGDSRLTRGGGGGERGIHEIFFSRQFILQNMTADFDRIFGRV